MKTQHCLWNAAKVLLRWKFRLINAYIKKKEVNLILFLKKQENEEKPNPKLAERKK